GPRAPTPRHLLGVQRRAREPRGPLPPPHLAQTPPRGLEGRGHGPDRRLEDLGVARISQLLSHGRREEGPAGQRRWALGGRGLDQPPRPRTLRVPAPPSRQMEWEAGPLRALDRRGDDADRTLPALRLDVVAQHRPTPVLQRPG